MRFTTYYGMDWAQPNPMYASKLQKELISTFNKLRSRTIQGQMFEVILEILMN